MFAREGDAPPQTAVGRRWELGVVGALGDLRQRLAGKRAQGLLVGVAPELDLDGHKGMRPTGPHRRIRLQSHVVAPVPLLAIRAWVELTPHTKEQPHKKHVEG